MNVQIGDIVGEIVCGNNILIDSPTYETFTQWLEDTFDDIEEGIADEEDYPKFFTYYENPAKYWPYVEKYLQS